MSRCECVAWSVLVVCETTIITYNKKKISEIAGGGLCGTLHFALGFWIIFPKNKEGKE